MLHCSSPPVRDGVMAPRADKAMPSPDLDWLQGIPGCCRYLGFLYYYSYSIQSMYQSMGVVLAILECMQDKEWQCQEPVACNKASSRDPYCCRPGVLYDRDKRVCFGKKSQCVKSRCSRRAGVRGGANLRRTRTGEQCNLLSNCTLSGARLLGTVRVKKAYLTPPDRP